MADQMSDPAARCPWCSELLPDAGAERCPSCGATLQAVPGTDVDLKGVTTLDTEAILRARSDAARPRSRILSFITGEPPPDSGGASPESLAPPADAVRREMLRLQIEAERADIEAETVALKADELARRGIHLSEIGAPLIVDPEAGMEPGAGPAPETVEPTTAEPDSGS